MALCAGACVRVGVTPLLPDGVPLHSRIPLKLHLHAGSWSLKLLSLFVIHCCMTRTCLYLICVSFGELSSSCGELGEIVRGVVTGLCGGVRLSTGEAPAPLLEVRRMPCTRGEWKCLGEH